MERTKRAASDTILAVLKRGPKLGLTAAEIAARAELNLNTTRTVVWALARAGDVAVLGTTESTGGRPANRYVLALAA